MHTTPRAVWHFICGLFVLVAILALAGAITIPLGFYLETQNFAAADLFSSRAWPLEKLAQYAWRGVQFIAFGSLHVTLATIATIFGVRGTMSLGRWVSTSKHA